MHESSTVTALQRQPADPREQMLTSLAKGSDELTTALEKVSIIFEETLAAHHKAIGSLSKTNEDLQASLITSEGRVRELEALLAAQKEAYEANAALQTQTQKESCDRMFEPCEKISQFLSKIELTIDNHYLGMGHFFTRNEQGLWSTVGFGPASRAVCIAHLKRLLGPYDDFDFEETVDQLAKNAAFEVRLLKIQMEALSGTEKQ